MLQRVQIKLMLVSTSTALFLTTLIYNQLKNSKPTGPSEKNTLYVGHLTRKKKL